MTTVVQVCDLSTQEAKAGGLQLGSYSEQHKKYKQNKTKNPITNKHWGSLAVTDPRPGVLGLGQFLPLSVSPSCSVPPAGL